MACYLIVLAPNKSPNLFQSWEEVEKFPPFGRWTIEKIRKEVNGSILGSQIPGNRYLCDRIELYKDYFFGVESNKVTRKVLGEVAREVIAELLDCRLFDRPFANLVDTSAQHCDLAITVHNHFQRKEVDSEGKEIKKFAYIIKNTYADTHQNKLTVRKGVLNSDEILVFGLIRDLLSTEMKAGFRNIPPE